MTKQSWWARTRRWFTVEPLLDVLSGWTRQLVGENTKNQGETEESDEPAHDDPQQGSE